MKKTKDPEFRHIGAHVPVELAEAITDEAFRRRMTRSEVIRRAIQTYLKNADRRLKRDRGRATL